MNYPVIFKLLSIILLSVATTFLASLGVALIFIDDPREGEALWRWGLCIGLALLLAGACWFSGRGGSNKMFRKEALSLIGLGWLLSSLIGALPYLLVVPGCSFPDALFESASGFTTTGATVFSDLESLPNSLLFFRCLSQWIGGLGVVVFFVAVLSFVGAGAKILYSNEASATSTEINSGRVQSGILQILYLYLFFSAVCTLVYWALGMSFYDAVVHMFTTISTGGFSPHSESFAYFQSPALEWACIVFMIIGGTSFLVMLRAIRLDWKELRQSTEVTAYFAVLVLFTALTSLMLLGNGTYGDVHETVRAAAFQIVSIMTTTGYATVDFDEWVAVGHIILLMCMFLGGCSGSTAGGVKVVRFIMGAKIALQHIEKAFRPNVVRPIQINGRVLNKDAQESALTYLVLSGFIILVSLLVLGIIQQDTAFEDLLSAILSCMLNIGPGLGEVGPTKVYAWLHPVTKVILALLMIMGRVELYAILVLFAPSLWKKFS